MFAEPCVEALDLDADSHQWAPPTKPRLEAQRTEALLGWAKTIETTTTDVSLPAWSLLIRGAGGNRARFGGLHESREDGPRYRWGGNVAVRASVRRISRQK